VKKREGEATSENRSKVGNRKRKGDWGRRVRGETEGSSPLVTEMVGAELRSAQREKEKIKAGKKILKGID